MSNEYNDFLRVVNKAIPSLLSHIDEKFGAMDNDNCSRHYNEVYPSAIGFPITGLFRAVNTTFTNYSKEIIKKRYENEAVEFFINDTCDIPIDVAIEKLPIIIDACVKSLKDVKSKITKAELSADQALENAKEAVNKPVGFWHSTTPVLEALQKASLSQAEASLQIMESQALLFNQQRIIAGCTKIVYVLCLNNVVCARAAIKAITDQLRGTASTMTEMAKQELTRLLQQLKQNVDIWEKQELMQEKLADLEERLQKLENIQS